MDASKAAQIKAHARAIAELLYEEAEVNRPEALKTFAGIELELREQILHYIGPELGEFFVKQRVGVQPDAVERSKASLARSKSRRSRPKG